MYYSPCHSKPIKCLCLLHIKFKNFSCHLVMCNHLSEIPVKISSLLNMKLTSKNSFLHRMIF